MQLLLLPLVTCTLFCGSVNSKPYSPYDFFTNISSSTTPQPSIIQGNATANSTERISLQKCREYSKVLFPVSVGTLAIGTPQFSVDTEECESSQGLIVGGVDAKEAEFPHMAALGSFEKGQANFRCGGSLISEKFVLTAAHCKAKNPTFVRLGDVNIKDTGFGLIYDYSIETFIIHEDYDRETRKHDIALVKLKDNVEFRETIKPACLMQSDSQIRNKAGIATGWGLTNAMDTSSVSDVLQKVELDIVKTQRCSTLYEKFSIGDTQLCAGEYKKDTCLGDSGGPLQVPSENSSCIHIIAGITSFGSENCGSGAFGVYTKVLPYLDWIEKIVWT